jgi:hypothetical protein
MRADIITIGDEILIGQVVDTNATYLGKMLNNIGIEVRQIHTISDNKIGKLMARNRSTTIEIKKKRENQKSKTNKMEHKNRNEQRKQEKRFFFPIIWWFICA